MPRRPDMPPLRPRATSTPIRSPSSRAWFERAEREVPLPEAITLATVDDAARPTRAWSCSRASTPTAFASSPTTSRRRRRSSTRRRRAALVVYWRELDRQVRVRGPVERLGRRRVRRLLRHPRRATRSSAPGPRRSRSRSRRARSSTAWSPRPTDALRGRRGAAARRTGAAICCAPRAIEFWQGQVGRLHDRFRYARDGEGWRIERLGP